MHHPECSEGRHSELSVSLVVYRTQVSTGQSTCLLFCLHNVSWLLTEAREDQPVDDNLTPLDLRTSVSEFTDSSDNTSCGEESKNKKAAKV